MDVARASRSGVRLLAPIAALAIAFAWLGTTPATAAGPAKAATQTVAIDGTKYVPEVLTVKQGETVTWINKDPFPHTVTAKGTFDSHEIAAGKSWKWTPRKAGEYPYTCTLHPNMTGMLRVASDAGAKAAAANADAPSDGLRIRAMTPRTLVGR